MQLKRTIVVVLAGTFLLAPSTASAYTFDPPSWFEDAVDLIKKRGGSCEPFNFTTVNPPGPFPPGFTPPQETTIDSGVDCSHKIPRRVAEQFGQNPARGEVCGGQAIDVTGTPGPGTTPRREEYGYGCRVFAKPGTNARPNRASWPCSRNATGGEGEPTRNERRWTAEKTKLHRKQTFKTLKQCLDPKRRKKR